MSDEFFELRGCRKDRAVESETLRSYVDCEIECYAVLAGAIEQMLDFSDRAQIARVLRRFADSLARSA